MRELTPADISRLNKGLVHDLSEALALGQYWPELYEAVSAALITARQPRQFHYPPVCSCRDGIAGVGHEYTCPIEPASTWRVTYGND